VNLVRLRRKAVAGSKLDRHRPDILNPVAGEHLHAKIRVLLRVERKLEGGYFLFMDALRPFSYLAGLLNRMDIKAIAASPSFAMRTRNHQAWETPYNSGVE
jgi:hypothetical protein